MWVCDWFVYAGVAVFNPWKRLSETLLTPLLCRDPAGLWSGYFPTTSINSMSFLSISLTISPRGNPLAAARASR